VWERVEGEKNFALGEGYNVREQERKKGWGVNAEEQPVADGGPYKTGGNEEVVHFSRD
jgi:hypothetical protein